MAKKVVVPLDGSAQLESIVAQAALEVDKDGELVLLRVLKPPSLGDEGEPSKDELENFRSLSHQQAMEYLTKVASSAGLAEGKYRCEFVLDPYPATAIANFAQQEGADLIAIYSNPPSGLAKFFKKDLGVQVNKASKVAVKALS
jgi:nucleotide-binding universal stress UspA family protein